MSVSTDAGTMEIVRLEEIFKMDIPCEADDDRPAEWKLIASCGHTADVCTYHKTLEMARFKSDYPNTYCHINKGQHVTELKAEPL